MSERYGWTPEQIGRLTMAQAMVYITQGKAQFGPRRTFKSMAEYRAWAARK